ncbi:hypothetical protein [Clostridium gasigenes]|uniref:hypothetical protein n=1 Tax=Clostridium gasigenes TaxID=94869 RepID=UPI001C0B0075|nr:hypothetical protein [Clostridium gasigenes]MBU3102733.1 hypothetical protein [Clostridium gasigenes]
MIRSTIYTMIAIFIALLLKGITYEVGGFNFANAPLFSLYFVYDCIILVAYGVTIEYVIQKTRANKDKKRQKDG